MLPTGPGDDDGLQRRHLVCPSYSGHPGRLVGLDQQAQNAAAERYRVAAASGELYWGR